MSSHLAQLWPGGGARRLPVTRDQAILLMAAINELFLGLDTYLAHNLNGTLITRERIPIAFGIISGILLILLGLLSWRRRRTASLLATTLFGLSMVVGILGTSFHLVRGALPTAPLGERLTLNLLIWAPPILAPLAFALVGLLGISAAWPETPVNSGTLHLPGNLHLHLPYSKSQAYFFIVSLGILIALISSVLDHARHPANTPWVWLPLLVGIFAGVIALGIGFINKPHRYDLATYAFAMSLLILTGLIGAYFHIRADLTSQNIIVVERFLRGAPFLAPLLFTNMGLLGLLVLLDPQENR